MAYKKIFKVCEWCREPFWGRRPTSRYCCKSCSMRARFSDPEYREKHATAMRGKTFSQEFRDMHSKRMKENNPSSNPETAARIAKKLQESGHYAKHLNGGNGTGPSEAEMVLQAALGQEWSIAVVQSTKPQPKGYPSHYKIDVARKDIMLGIECDGWSHTLPGRAEQDAKKTAFLESKGWTILRFSNHEILADTKRVVEQVNEVVRRLCTT